MRCPRQVAMSLDLTISLEVGLGYLFAENSSFYTQSDFVAIKAAGLNSVRIPIGYWAVDVNDEEPYVSGQVGTWRIPCSPQYPYLIQAVYWAYQSGLTVLVDLHGAPGSQNGFDHSGLIGPVLFPTNSSNIDRSLGVLKNFSDEFSQSLYNGTVIGERLQVLDSPQASSCSTSRASPTHSRWTRSSRSTLPGRARSPPLAYPSTRMVSCSGRRRSPRCLLRPVVLVRIHHSVDHIHHRHAPVLRLLAA